MPTYCKKYAIPLVMPKIRIRRLLRNFKLRFFVNRLTTSMVRAATRNLRKTNVYASMYCKPILMAGKEVPHKKPANTVSSTAFFLLSNSQSTFS